MTPFEDYAEQSNLAHKIYGKGATGFDLWLVDNMPKTEREVAAMRKAWEAGGMFAIDEIAPLFIREEQRLVERIQSDEAEIKALKRLRDDLHETTNRYLERARRAENLLEGWKLRYRLLRNNLSASYGRPGSNALAQTLTVLWQETKDKINAVRELELKPTDSPALYLQQFGRALRSGYKPPSRWQKVKRFFSAWLNA